MPQERIYATGEHIGPYEVVRVLATGGMGIVYEARPDPRRRADLRALGLDRVALKVARVDALPADRHERKLVVARIDREFRTLVGLMPLRHPNVIDVYDFGWEAGVPYYVMGLVDGVTLDQALEERPRLGQITHVFAKLCGAVAFLHNLGICHRDIKPSNVMLRADGGEPILLDFGICLPPAQRTLTGPRDLLGTPLYLSPEYAAHWLDPEQVRPYIAAPTDDVWALGVILYEILTGGVPWQSPPERREALLKEIRDVTPPHPCEVYAQAPRALGDVVMRMLAREPRERPRDASEVLGLLGKVAESVDVLGRVPARRGVSRPASLEQPPERPPPRPRRTGRLRSVLVQLTVTTALAVSGFGLGYFARGRSPVVAPPGLDLQTHVSRDPGLDAPIPILPPALGSYAPYDGPEVGDEWSRELVTITGGIPLPRRPYRGQMRAPCPSPYVEMVGACWKEVRPVYPDGSYAPCTSDMIEVRSRDGSWRCFSPVLTPPSSVEQMDGGRR